MTPSTTRLFAALTMMLALATPWRAPAAEGPAARAGLAAAAKPASTRTPEGASKAPEPTPADTAQDAALEAFVDGLVRDSLVQDHIAGATVAIVQDGRVVLKKGYGAASLDPWRPVDPDRTLFRLGSVSKTFTWLTEGIY